MKLAIIIEHFDPTRGGAERLAVWCANEMARRGHEVHVVCHDVAPRINRYRQATLRASHDADLSHRAHPPAELAHDGLHVHRLRGMRLSTALGFRLFGARARAWLRAHQPDLVHSFSVACPGDIYHAYAGVYAALQTQAAASRDTGTAAAWKRWMQRLPGKQRTLAALERRALCGREAGPRRSAAAGARFVISLSGMMTRQLAEAYGKTVARKLVELPAPQLAAPAAQTPAEIARRRDWFRAHYQLTPADRVALFVGHDFRRKGLRYAIEAVARTRHWKLLVVGLGKVHEYIELAESLGIAPGRDQPEAHAPARILFVGPTREMATVYAAADALLLPTFYEPAGLVVQEAFAHGLPVVSTSFLGAGELVKQHNAGAIVDSPRDVDALAAALDALPPAGTPAQHDMASRALAAAQGFSPQAFADRLEALYRAAKPYP